MFSNYFKKNRCFWIVFIGILLMGASVALTEIIPHYRIPDTGQTKCYDDKGNEINPCPKPGEPFYGQDANYSINPMSFTKLDTRGNDLPDSAKEWTMVRDNNTGLIWEKKNDNWFSINDKNKKYTWEEAHKFAEKLNTKKFGGRSDWRLPTYHELQSIVDYGKYNPAINTKYFPNTQQEYWSFDSYKNRLKSVWFVDFDKGAMFDRFKDIQDSVRCVSGGEAQSFGNLVINHDGTVTDKDTALVWQQGEAGEMKWKDALNYCENLTLAGKDDWRLPTVKELLSIVRPDKYEPAANTQYFPKIIASWYWSSSYSENGPKNAWGMSFNNGYVGFDVKDNNSYVRCVRGGQAQSFDYLVTDTTPPQITITEPKVQRGIKWKESADKIMVRGIATDESGVFQVLVNGTKAKLLKNNQFEAVALLRVGENRITVQATDVKNNSATEVFSIERLPETPIIGSTQRPEPTISELTGWYSKQYAIVIGIDAYQNRNIATLKNAVNDAKSVAKMFRNMGFQVIELYDSQATKRAINNAISEIHRKAGKNDSVIFYFAGHGQGIRLHNKEQEGYIIPYNADLDLQSTNVIQYDDETISLSRLRIYAKDMKAKHIALILDSCFSGLAMKRAIHPTTTFSIGYYNDLLARKAINILTAGDDHPVSDGTGHSPFTRALLNALEKRNLDLHDRDGFSTFMQLAVYVKEKVEKATDRRQRPQFDNLSMDDGDFVFKMK